STEQGLQLRAELHGLYEQGLRRVGEGAGLGDLTPAVLGELTRILQGALQIVAEDVLLRRLGAGRRPELDDPFDPPRDAPGLIDPDRVGAPPGGTPGPRLVPLLGLLNTDKLQAVAAGQDLGRGQLP